MTPFSDALKAPGVAQIWNLATEAGRMALNGEITRQATIVAYADDFKLMMMVTLAALPLVLLLRRGASAGGAESAVME